MLVYLIKNLIWPNNGLAPCNPAELSDKETGVTAGGGIVHIHQAIPDNLLSNYLTSQPARPSNIACPGLPNNSNFMTANIL